MVMFLLVKEMVNHIQNGAVIKSMINICVVCIICGFILNIGIVGEYISSELTHRLHYFSSYFISSCSILIVYVFSCFFFAIENCD